MNGTGTPLLLTEDHPLHRVQRVAIGVGAAALLVCALVVSSAVFLILELDRPLDGMIQISSAPLREALAQLGR